MATKIASCLPFGCYLWQKFCWGTREHYMVSPSVNSRNEQSVKLWLQRSSEVLSPAPSVIHCPYLYKGKDVFLFHWTDKKITCTDAWMMWWWKCLLKRKLKVLKRTGSLGSVASPNDQDKKKYIIFLLFEQLISFSLSHLPGAELQWKEIVYHFVIADL